MSELIEKRIEAGNLRRHLLANVSVFVLLGYAGTTQMALAASADGDRPTVWVELGGQAERVDGVRSVLSPPFLADTPSDLVAPMIDSQRPSRYSLGAEGKVTFLPHGTDLIISAALRYGRSQNARHLNVQSAPPYVLIYNPRVVGASGGVFLPTKAQFGDGQTEFKETHLILDFQAGKDVGVGLFGREGSSVVSAGVRFAQFTSSSNASLHARPEYRFGAIHHGSRQLYRSSPVPHYITIAYQSADKFYRMNAASLQVARSSRALGPSVSWAASLPVISEDRGASLDVDWGLNAAVLFGRQRTRTHHQTSGSYFSKTGGRFKYHTTPDGTYTRGYTVRRGNYEHGPFNRTSSRMVTIPNVGGFAAISLKFPNAKISLGYRADFFFNANDTGIDVRRDTNANYFGPYASISIGLGG